MTDTKKKYHWYFLVDESVPDTTKEKYASAVSGVNSDKWGISIKYGTWQEIFGRQSEAYIKKYSRFLMGEYAKKLKTIDDTTCAKPPLSKSFFQHPNRGTAICISILNETPQVVAGISFTMGDGGKTPFNLEGEYSCLKTGNLKLYREPEEHQTATNAHDFAIRESYESELTAPLLYLLFAVGANLYEKGHTTHAFWSAPRNNLAIYHKICNIFTQVDMTPKESLLYGTLPPEVSCKVETFLVSARLNKVRPITECSEKARLYRKMFYGTYQEIHDAMEYIHATPQKVRELDIA